MLYPKRNFLIVWIFKTYVKWLVSRQFHEFIFNNVQVDPDRSVLLIANHFSFWDGLILFCLNQKLFKKKFHVMVLQETAYHMGILRYGGAYSVTKNSRDMLTSLDYTAKLLNDPQNLVLMFPQGKLYSNFVSRINFEKGILKPMNKAEGKFQLVFAATFIQYFKHKKPSVTVYLKNEDKSYVNENIGELERSYQQHYTESKDLQTEIEIK
ncbi:1-acyl-sn-glycerol-3-phosphate acyltransferase [Mucilaginibacter segetis]|uniref:1-acyl-sn-glycerol-3-phosphate acyltransferase n=1 Tax=Mucilaginibacter segetis TaxID=2793071 RepID=A0A934ULF1_9SPHI|nr:1-acyl-sn-glycerol-3-phosphate acyltransferase [Mucilaginibacter segetis]MBK0377905.1 1-acyl-sn-glycerol-3-phosphate acyltransferase [Mucilaginibacter segetis]